MDMHRMISIEIKLKESLWYRFRFKFSAEIIFQIHLLALLFFNVHEILNIDFLF